MHVYVCMYVYVHTRVCMYMCVCIHVCVCMYNISGEMSGGKCPTQNGRGNCPGELPGGNCPGGNCPGGIVLHPSLVFHVPACELSPHLVLLAPFSSVHCI